MAISWTLKSFLAREHGVYKLVDLQKMITQKTGIIVSTQNLGNYVNKKPKSIKPQTLELICTTLSCELNDFLKITPSKKKRRKKSKKLSYKNTPKDKIGKKFFPNPDHYETL